MLHLDDLLRQMIELGGSDLHLCSTMTPKIRLHGNLVPLPERDPIPPEEMLRILEEVAPPVRWEWYVKNWDMDYAYEIKGLARFRVNYLNNYYGPAAVMRVIPTKIMSIDALKLPPILRNVCENKNGLVLVTGPAGSGKSTTLAAMIEHINSHRSAHIICLEDPIEYLHAHKQSLIEQREIYEDAPSFAHALQAVFRQSPDVIMVGEMRDLPTISTAITAAETGHLVIGTLHTLDAAQSVDRVIDLFPADQQHQIRLQFSQVVLAVLSQILLNRVGGGRIAAFEIMLATPMIRKFIREGNTGEIPANLEMGASEGKQSLDQAMAELVRRGLVAREEALLASSHPAHLADLLDAGP